MFAIALALSFLSAPPAEYAYVSEFNRPGELVGWTFRGNEPSWEDEDLHVTGSAVGFLPLTMPAGASYALEAQVRYERGEERTPGWVGLQFAAGDPADPDVGDESGLLLFHLLDEHEFVIIERDTGERLLHVYGYPAEDLLNETDAQGDAVSNIRLEVHRLEPPRRPVIRIFANGVFLAERVMGTPELPAGEPHRLAMAVNDVEDSVWERIEAKPIEPVPYRLYDTEVTDRAPDNVFPACPEPAEEVALLEVEDMTRLDRFTAFVLQGLVNRTQPRIMTDACNYAQVEVPGDWAHLVEAQGRRLIAGNTLGGLIAEFAGELAGCVLYDPAWFEDPATEELINVVQNVCAVENAVPLTEAQLEALEGVVELEVVMDARGKWASGKEGLAWAVEEILPRCSGEGIAHLQVWPPFAPSRDFLVAHKVFTFQSARYEGTYEEYAYYVDLLAKTKAGTPVYGMSYLTGYGGPPHNYFTENVIFDIPGELGKFFVYTFSCGNLSYHSGVDVTPTQQPAPAAPVYDTEGVYVCVLNSDGDNPSWSMNLRRAGWDHPDRGALPVAMSFAPSLLELCPDVCQQYFDEAKPGEMFIVSGHGPGNVGYRHAVEKLGARLRPELRPDVKELFYRQLEASLEGMGVPALNPFDSSMTDAGAIAENTDHLRMMLAGYNSPGFSLPPPAPARLDGVWMLPPFSNYPLRGEAEELARAYAARVREAAEAGDGPTFLYMWVLGNTFIGDYSFLRHLKNEVGGEAVFVTPTQMAELLDEARKRGEL